MKLICGSNVTLDGNIHIYFSQKQLPQYVHALSYHRVRGLYIQAVVFAATIVCNIRYLQIVVNEKDSSNTWCKAGSTCTITELENVLNVRSEGCDFDSICGISTESKTTMYYVVGVLVAVCFAQASYIFLHCCKRCPYAPRSSIITQRSITDDGILLNRLVSDDTDSIDSNDNVT